MGKKKDNYSNFKKVVHTTTVKIRFNECDPLGIVWHGNYIKYFEDAREEFCKLHGIDYLVVQKNGYATPIIKSMCEHKLPLTYGDVATVETTFVSTPAAKLIFTYKIFNPEGKLACIGETIQVFIDKDGVLQLTNPEFISLWKAKENLLD